MIGISFLLLLVVPADEPVKPKFPLGRETTFVTGPLDKDGYVDYAAALNERLGKGVTPDKNANVLIWKALGPQPSGWRPMPPEFFKALGIDEPPERGDYFIDLHSFLKEDSKLDQSKWDATQNLVSRFGQQPWMAKDHPRIAEWLAANEKPLAVVIEATRRPAYFNPIAPKRTAIERGMLFDVPLSGVMSCRGLASALTARAMLRMNEGKFDDAWADLFACHRLGRLMGHCATFIEGLTASAIDIMAARAEIAYLDRAPLRGDQIRARLKELQNLPPLPTFAEIADIGERFTFLDCLGFIRREGPGWIEVFTDGKPKKVDPKTLQALDEVDWAPALRDANRWYDRLAAVGRLPDRASRKKEMDRIEDDLKALKKEFDEPANALKLVGVVTGAFIPEKTAGKTICDIMIALLAPGNTKVYTGRDRCEQVQRNIQVAFALAAYRSDNGHYPAKLEDLAPKYLPSIPADLFSGKPLIYRPTENGYLLYSVGPNEKDDGGRTADDAPPGDDLVVRMPLPPLMAKR